MIPTIFSGLILMKKRRMMDVFPRHLRKLWKEWELVGAALLSLTLQIVLIVLGNRRKYIHGVWFKVIVWFAYMLADSVATIALGILSNDLAQIYDDEGHIDLAKELKAFWAPFFLLHLGGPDTITAYSLEDNELYLRHLFGLIAQITVAVYILILAWTGSLLSYLSIVVVVVGCIKYVERILSLWEASSDKLRKTFLSDPDPRPNYSKLMEECRLKDAEGFHVDIEMVDPDNFDLTAPAESTASEHNIIQAHALFQTFKSLFADLILSFHDRERSLALFEGMSDENAFKMIEIELGFMYDLLYTKAPAIYTRCGLARRFITFSLTCFAFLYFILDDRFSYKSIDAVVTFLLLVIAVVLEICAAVGVLVSDQTRTWLIKHRRARAVVIFLEKRFECLKVQTWSKSMGQYSLPWLSLKEKRSFEIIEEFWYKEYINFPDDYRKLIFNHVRKKSRQFNEKQATGESRSASYRLRTALKDFCSKWGKHMLDEYKPKYPILKWSILEWSISVEFDQSILIWHMATEICYYSKDTPENLSGGDELIREFSLHMSRYMFYLLVICPSMLPEGIGFIRLRETRAEIMDFLKVQILSSGKVDERSATWALLLELHKDMPHMQGGDATKSVLSDACRLASMLLTIPDANNRWNLIRDMWLELLAYAACHCKGSQHAQQLRRGGELLTHVWLLMAHFGLSEQFQISHHRAVPVLSTK